MLLFNYNEVGKVAKYHLLASAGEKIILVLKLYTAEDHFYVAKCNLGKVNLEARPVTSFPSYTRGGPMPLAGATRDLYTQLLACGSLQNIFAIACCLHAILCFGFFPSLPPS